MSFNQSLNKVCNARYKTWLGLAKFHITVSLVNLIFDRIIAIYRDKPLLKPLLK